MKCHICENPSVYIFHSKVLLKYDVSYFQCSNCGFIQTEEPYWLNEAYADAISLLDVGLVERNIYLSKLLSPILKQYFNYKAKFLDYAGGYGLFVRLMRDQGFNYYRKDPYCENIFAKCFDYEDLPRPVRFELLTAFEVFEHLTAPMEGLNNMLEHTDNILFSTELQPAMDIKSVTDWQYFVPESRPTYCFLYSSLHCN
jgi:2-polyprenyl-3-methyl-5-hydroxy-6-metoxy-1,4-benzoquinol methylase